MSTIKDQTKPKMPKVKKSKNIYHGMNTSSLPKSYDQKKHNRKKTYQGKLR